MDRNRDHGLPVRCSVPYWWTGNTGMDGVKVKIRIGKREIYIKFNRYKDKIGATLIMKYRKLDENVGGISSLTRDNMHVGFFDCDNWEIDLQKLEEIQIAFDLSTLYVIRSKEKSYHVICLDKKDLCDWIKIMRYWDKDMFEGYYSMSLARSKFILRITTKDKRELPELAWVLERNNKEEKSHAHYRFLDVRYRIPEPKGLDGYTQLEVENYVTVQSR